MSHINIYLTNLGKYNEGELIGEWVELPVSNAELKEVLNRIGINEIYEEYFITDYETDIPGFSIDEYDDPYQLNKIAALLDQMSEWDFKILKNAIEAGYVQPKIQDIEDFDSSRFILYEDVDNATDLGYADIESTYEGIENVPADVLAAHFDYESYGRDIRLTFHIWDFISDDEDSIAEACDAYGVSDVEDIDAYMYYGVSDDQELGEFLVNDTYGDVSEMGAESLSNYFDYEDYANSTMVHPGVGAFTTDGFIEDTSR